MKINEFLKGENIGKRYKDEFNSLFTVRKYDWCNNIGLIKDNDMPIENTMCLDDILEMEFQEV